MCVCVWYSLRFKLIQNFFMFIVLNLMLLVKNERYNSRVLSHKNVNIIFLLLYLKTERMHAICKVNLSYNWVFVREVKGKLMSSNSLPLYCCLVIILFKWCFQLIKMRHFLCGWNMVFLFCFYAATFVHLSLHYTTKKIKKSSCKIKDGP